MLSEHEPQASVFTAFSSSPKLDRNTDNMFSISLRKYRDEEKEKQLVYFDHQNVDSLVRAIITSTARASSVFLSSYRNMVLNQSACVVGLGYFLI